MKKQLGHEAGGLPQLPLARSLGPESHRRLSQRQQKVATLSRLVAAHG